MIINFSTSRQMKMGDMMCTVLDKIRGKTPGELLLEYGSKDDLPINLSQLLENIGISVLPMDFKEIEKKLNRGKIYGMVLKDYDNAAIFYDEEQAYHRQKFTIAHELAHCCIDGHSNNKVVHIEFRVDKEEKSEHEKRMNIFAGELLIPLDKLKEVYLSLELISSEVLAMKFGVSVSVMEARLDYLKVSYFNRSGASVIYG